MAAETWHHTSNGQPSTQNSCEDFPRLSIYIQLRLENGFDFIVYKVSSTLPFLIILQTCDNMVWV